MKKTLTTEQRKKIERFVLYPIVGLISVLVIYLLFFASSDSDLESQKGANTEITDATTAQLVEDKTKAYENEFLSKKDAEREYIKDMGMMLAGGNKDDEQSQAPADELYLDGRRTDVKPSEAVSKAEQSITASTNAYRDINRNLGSFYDTPKKDTEKEQMQKRIEELEAQQLAQMQQQPQLPTMEEQVALLEKSYELAAKYGGQQGAPSTTRLEQVSTPTTQESNYKNGKAQIANIKQVQEQTVSRLAQPMTNEEFAEQYSQPRQMGFNTAVGKVGLSTKNTISACVHSNQTIKDGQAVRMRLLEPMVAGDKIMPKGAMITGIGKVAGERLYINVTMLEHQGTITPVELMVADSDGQEGIFIPNSMEVSAVKEVAANLGSNLGTTINLTSQSAEDVLLTELGKGAIEGASQYISKKMQEVKVHLKEGYKLMLYQEQN